MRFHSSKLNFKWSEVGEAVLWHQDIRPARTPTLPRWDQVGYRSIFTAQPVAYGGPA